MPPKKAPSPPAAGTPVAAPPQPPGTGLSLVQRALRKLGLVRDIDFALYLPMRYEDETRVVRLADTRDGDTAQIEGVVTEAEVAYRPRRQLIVTIDDGNASAGATTPHREPAASTPGAAAGQQRATAPAEISLAQAWNSEP